MSSAVAVNPKLQYVVVEVNSSSEEMTTSSSNKKKKLGNVFNENKNLHLVVALDLVPALEAKWDLKLTVKARLTGAELENCRFSITIMLLTFGSVLIM